MEQKLELAHADLPALSRFVAAWLVDYQNLVGRGFDDGLRDAVRDKAQQLIREPLEHKGLWDLPDVYIVVGELASVPAICFNWNEELNNGVGGEDEGEHMARVAADFIRAFEYDTGHRLQVTETLAEWLRGAEQRHPDLWADLDTYGLFSPGPPPPPAPPAPPLPVALEPPLPPPEMALAASPANANAAASSGASRRRGHRARQATPPSRRYPSRVRRTPERLTYGYAFPWPASGFYRDDDLYHYPDQQ